jgi:hypothetical protein
MAKIKLIGKGFIQFEDTLINLLAYKEIDKYTFGLDEDPEGNSAYGITFTPLTPTEDDVKNGVDGTFFLTEYTEEEKEEFEADFETILSALKDKQD